MVVQINFRRQNALLYIFIRDVVLGVSGGWPCHRINKNLKYKKQFKKLFELRTRKNWYNFSYLDFCLTLLHEQCPYSKFSALYFATFGLLIRRFTLYITVFNPNTGKTDQKNSEYGHFLQCNLYKHSRGVFMTLLNIYDQTFLRK